MLLLHILTLTIVYAQLRSPLCVRLLLARCVFYGNQFSPMTRLTAQQRAELVQLHEQGLSLDAIMKRTGHNHHTVLRWARRFAAEALQDRARTGRPVTRTTRELVFSIRRLVANAVSRPDGPLPRFARGALPSARALCGVFSSLMVLPPMLNHKRLYSALATSSGGCGSLLNRKGVIGDAACLPRRHLCVFPVLTVGMM